MSRCTLNELLRCGQHDAAGLLRRGQHDAALGRNFRRGDYLRRRGLNRRHIRAHAASLRAHVPGRKPPDYAGRGVLRRRPLRARLAAVGRALALSLEPGASHAVLAVDLRHYRRVASDVRVVLPRELAVSGLQLLERAYALKIVYTIFAHKAIQILKGEVPAVAVARDGARAALHPLDDPRAQRAEQEGIGRVLEIAVVFLAGYERGEGRLQQLLQPFLGALGYHAKAGVDNGVPRARARYAPERVIEAGYLRRDALRADAAETAYAAEQIGERALARADERGVEPRLPFGVALVYLLRIGVSGRARAHERGAAEPGYPAGRAGRHAGRAESPAAERACKYARRHV